MKAPWTIEGVFEEDCEIEEGSWWCTVNEKRAVELAEHREYDEIFRIKPTERTVEQNKRFRQLAQRRWNRSLGLTPIEWPFVDGKRYRVTVEEIE